MSDVTVSAEVVEEVRPIDLSADVLDEQLIGQLVDRARAGEGQAAGGRRTGGGRAALSYRQNALVGDARASGYREGTA